ncbi:hypothetical protein DPMN_025539 [Dreissena polymorpha]|uniref:Uncharacterized protein n=1 Tax=Dreissena polymorpha TaxID=45954 RepID=A0A9D4LQX7_DREPO|nr:hypothetical protein DPMN_025539 [Dreissena polymorpha]
MTKFNEDWTKIRLLYIIWKTAPTPGGHFHEDWTKNKTSRVLTRKTAPPPIGRPYIIGTDVLTNFELSQDIIRKNLLTKFHDDQTINVASRVLTRQNHIVLRIAKKVPMAWPYDRLTDTQSANHKSPPVSPVADNKPVYTLKQRLGFHRTVQLYMPNFYTNVSHVIQLTGTIFEFNSCIKETNVLSKFHENWAKNVTSTVFTCFHYIHIEKNAPPTGSHVFSPIPTIYKLVRDINKTNVLTNFYDDWAKIVTSSVFTREKCAAPGGHVFSPISTIFELVRDIN